MNTQIRLGFTQCEHSLNNNCFTNATDKYNDIDIQVLVCCFKKGYTFSAIPFSDT